MEPDASTASAAASTSATTPTRFLTTPSPPLPQTQRRYRPKYLFTSPPPSGREHIPKFSTSQKNPSRKLFKTVVNTGRGFIPMDEPPFRIREPIPEFSKPHPDPSGKLFNPVISSSRGYMHIGPPAPRFREPVPKFSMSQQDPPPQKISHPFVSSDRDFMRKSTGPFSTDQTVIVADLGHAAGAVDRSPCRVRPPPLDYLRPSVHKTRAPTLLHGLQHKSPIESSHLSLAKGKGVAPSASPKIVPPSSSAECSDSKKKGERTNVETFAVVRDRKARITEGASLYELCRSWLRNGLPEEDYQLPHENYKMILPKPLPRAMDGATRPEKKEDNEEETKNEEEESFDHLTPEDLLKEHVMRGKKVRARLREERRERISRYRHRIALILAKLDEPPNNDTPTKDQPYE